MKCRSKLGLSIAFLVSVSSSALGECKCERVQPSETTHWGGNISIELEQKNHVKILRGLVEGNETRLQGALVEVFTYTDSPSREPSNETQEKPKQTRVAACRTRADGKFCFRKLASGKYELRSSIGTGWDVTFVNVVVDAKGGKDEPIHVSMHVGTRAK
jgi:hypothetical protein